MERPGCWRGRGSGSRGLGGEAGLPEGAGRARGARRGPAEGLRAGCGREGRQRAQGWQRSGLAGSRAPAAASRPERSPHGAAPPEGGPPHPEPLRGPPPSQPLSSSPGNAPAGVSELPPRPPPAPLSPTAAPSHFPWRWWEGGSTQILSPAGWGFLARSSRHQFQPFQPPHALPAVSQDPPEHGWGTARTRTRTGGLRAGRGGVWQGGLADPP